MSTKQYLLTRIYNIILSTRQNEYLHIYLLSRIESATDTIETEGTSFNANMMNNNIS